MTINPIRPALLRLFLCILLMAPGTAAAQAASDDRGPPIRMDMEIGLAVLDPIHTINATPLFVTPGIQLRTRGRVFAFAGVRALLFALPFVSGSGAEFVHDEEGNFGHRNTGGLGGGPWVRGGVGFALTDSPRAPTLTLGGGSFGVNKGSHPWVGASAGVQVLRRWRVEAELGYDRNWVEDTFIEMDTIAPYGPAEVLYVDRTERWYRTTQIGIRYVP
ncbi:MAG TPA: hypothetical protein VFY65_03735 [Longimicrobium sp.]|nr:hypothetical protein [Longimicrobium sp.]